MAQLGDLIVSGKARFLNKISGNIDSADKVNNKLNLTVSGHGTATYEYDGSSPVSVHIGGITPAEHTHGNIQNFGTLQTNDITIASGDKLVVTDSSDSSRIARTSLSFDGSTATKCLTQKGTWETFASINTDTKVTQTNVTTSATYSIPLCKTYNTTTETDSLYKNLGINYYLNGTQASLCINEPGKDSTSTLSGSYITSQGIQIMSRTSTTATPDILAIGSTDIGFMTTETWDGTNVSLKAAVIAAKGTVRQEILSNFPSGAEYPIALAYSSSTSAEDNKIYKISNLKYDPSWGNLTLSSSSGVNSKVQLGNSGRVDDSNNTWTTGEVIITDTDSKTLTVESRDIYNSSKWDGANTSLKTAITTLADRNWYTYIGFNDKTSVAANTTVNMGSWKPTVGGVYIIFYCAKFSSNATGIRKLNIATTATGVDGMDRFGQVTVQACNGSYTHVVFSTMETVTANTTYYFNARHTASAALDITASGLKIMRIR